MFGLYFSWSDESFEVVIEDPFSALSWASGEMKMPAYICEPWSSYVFTLKKNQDFFALFPASVFAKKFQSQEFDQYYAYPLSHLNLDLNVEKVEVKDSVFRDSDFVISWNLQEEPCWFSAYQAKDRDQDQILNFLLALAEERLSEAADLLNFNQKLLPFIEVLQRCEKSHWEAKNGKLEMQALCETGAWPMNLRYRVWIEKGSLYLGIAVL